MKINLDPLEVARIFKATKPGQSHDLVYAKWRQHVVLVARHCAQQDSGFDYSKFYDECGLGSFLPPTAEQKST